MLELAGAFNKDIKSLKDFILLVAVDAKNYQKAATDVVNVLVGEQKVPGVYVTLNKPYEVMQRNL